jgi:hypothetical protein
MDAAVSQLHKKLIDALTELAASLIRNGGDPAAVQKFVDGELDRIEARHAEMRGMASCVGPDEVTNL